MKFIDKFSGILKIGKAKPGYDVERYLDQEGKEPGNTTTHLKQAKSYEKGGKPEEAAKEYLLGAASLTRSGHYPQALTIYKHVLKLNPMLDKVELKIAEIYAKMGELENAYSVYGRLLEVYDKRGSEDKSQEIMCLMAELSIQKSHKGARVQPSSERSRLAASAVANTASADIPKPMPPDRERKKVAFDLGAELETHQPLEAKGFSRITAEKTYEFNDIFTELKRTDKGSTEFPNFNYHMGVACRQMGHIDEAIEQFRLALEKGQNPCETAHLLGRCFWDKGLREEARRSFEIALKVEGIPQEKIREINDDLALIT